MIPRAKSPLIRNEIDRMRERRHQRTDALADFVQVLVFKRLIDRQVVDPLAEMRSRGQFLPGAGRTGDGRYLHVARQQPGRSQRQYAQLQAGRKTPRIGDVARRADLFAVQFRQAVHELPVPDRSSRLQPKILAQVDDPHRIGNRRGF